VRVNYDRIRGRVKRNATRQKQKFNLGYIYERRWANALRRHGRTKGVGLNCGFYRMRFHGVVVGGGRSTARACGRQHECLMERAGSLGSTREVVSLSLSLASSSSPSDITRDNVTRRSNKGTRRRGGRARGMDKVTDRLRGVGGAQGRDSFPRGWPFLWGFKSAALTFLEIHTNLIRAHANPPRSK